jgi:sn-2 palmitoyl-lipid 9-desaturase
MQLLEKIAVAPNGRRWHFENIFWLVSVQVLAVAAFFWFSWSGLFIALFGVFVLAPLGINVGYHRLLTHRGFTSPKFVRYFLATLGAALGAGPPLYWVAMHRVHHRFSDTNKDPHNSRLGFWYCHMLHLFYVDPLATEETLKTYAPDLMKEPYLVFLNRFWPLFALPILGFLYWGGGISWVLWGGFFRTALMWHIMWFVNSATHMWGYRNYETKDYTTNSWWVGILAAGEGWHNNHHADPACASHGHKWWEFDLSFWMIRIMEMCGLAKNVKRPQMKILPQPENFS